MPQSRPSASSRILRNSFWYGLETVIEAVVFLTASIAVARYLGPQKLGYYSFINFFVTVVTRTSGSGLAGATRKYMSEFLALSKPGTARAVYNLAYRYQLLGSILITLLGMATVILFGNASFKIVSCILVVSIIPGIMSWVPGEANNAMEDASQNTISAFGYFISYAIVIILTISFRWDLLGVASASLVGRTVEVVLRTRSLHRRLRSMPLDVLSAETTARIRRFCLQAIGIQLLTTVVWDRSEMVFLKAYSSLEQIAFYSISFSLANSLLSLPRAFGSAAGMTVMVEAARDRLRTNRIIKNTLRYTFFIVVPLHLGAAAITARAIGLAYGAKYLGAVPVMIVAALLSVPRAAEELPAVLLRAGDKQQKIFILLAITGVVNIGLDAAFIPHFAAVGAAWANGLAQCLGVACMWIAARKIYHFDFPVGAAARIISAAGVMSILAAAVVHYVPGLPGLILAVTTALPVYIFLVRLFRALEGDDRERFSTIGNHLPGPARKGFLALIAFATPVSAEIDQI